MLSYEIIIIISILSFFQQNSYLFEIKKINFVIRQILIIIIETLDRKKSTGEIDFELKFDKNYKLLLNKKLKLYFILNWLKDCLIKFKIMLRSVLYTLLKSFYCCRFDLFNQRFIA